MKPRRVLYAAIYRGSVVSPEDSVMTEMDDVRLRVENGPFSFSYSVPIVTIRPSQAMMTPWREKCQRTSRPLHFSRD